MRSSIKLGNLDLAREDVTVHEQKGRPSQLEPRPTGDGGGVEVGDRVAKSRTTAGRRKTIRIWGGRNNISRGGKNQLGGSVRGHPADLKKHHYRDQPDPHRPIQLGSIAVSHVIWRRKNIPKRFTDAGRPLVFLVRG